MSAPAVKGNEKRLEVLCPSCRKVAMVKPGQEKATCKACGREWAVKGKAQLVQMGVR